jgi:hypothetical protein
VRVFNFVINRRGCKKPLDRKTAIALEKLAKAAYEEQVREIRARRWMGEKAAILKAAKEKKS